MLLQKNHLINLNGIYPCPSCGTKGGILQLITLTEAFGCDRCQQIFVVDENGQKLAQLTTVHGEKRAWTWTGRRWSLVKTPRHFNYLSLVGAGILILVIIGVMIHRGLTGNLTQPPRSSIVNVLFWTSLVMLLVMGPIWLLYSSYQR